MKRENKLITRQQTNEQQEMTQGQAHHQPAREFASVEEMLRHDALHTPLPPTIAHRLQSSLSQTPAPPLPWWRRLFG